MTPPKMIHSDKLHLVTHYDNMNSEDREKVFSSYEFNYSTKIYKLKKFHQLENETEIIRKLNESGW